MDNEEELQVQEAAEPAKELSPKNFCGEAWERQPTESSVAWEAFLCYRNMGAKRSNAKVARQLGKSKQLIDRWSSHHKWVRRIEIYELEQEREYRLEVAEYRRTMARRQAANALLLQDAALKALKKKFGDDLSKINAKSMKNGEILKYFVDASKIERAAMGETNDGEEDSTPIPISSNDDRKPAIPVTFSGRIEGALELLEAARARANNGTVEQSD